MQLRTSPVIYENFHERFKRKFNFEEYESVDKATVFFGMYRQRDIQTTAEHKGIKIIWFAGVDAIKPKTLHIIKNRPEFKDAIVIAESRWIEQDLDVAGIKYESISLFMDDLYAWKPEPLGDSLYWYNARNSRYGKQYLDIVQRAIPSLNIIIHDSGEIPRSQMPEVYKQCFAAIRPVDHDGMSQTVGEVALMGRYTIWNGTGPFAVPYSDVNDMVNQIIRLRESNYNYKLIAKRSREYFKENEAKWCDLVLRLCGTSELDATGIFKEDRGRCTSFFRVMRREVVDMLPDKFGNEQFERPYISEHMQRLGKKELVTTKSSGFVATEWKGMQNKGYEPGFKSNTHDPKYD